MKRVLKILLFPVTLSLSLLVVVLRVLCSLSTMVLCLLAFVLVLFGAATMILLQDMPGGWQFFLVAWLISPLGVPLLANLIVEALGAFANRLRTI